MPIMYVSDLVSAIFFGMIVLDVGKHVFHHVLCDVT